MISNSKVELAFRSEICPRLGSECQVIRPPPGMILRRHETKVLLRLHRDNAKPDFDYSAESKIGTISDALMDEAKKKGWVVISMKDDWKTIFPEMMQMAPSRSSLGAVTKLPVTAFRLCRIGTTPCGFIDRIEKFSTGSGSFPRHSRNENKTDDEEE